MRTLTLSKKLTQQQTNDLLGKILDDKCFDVLIDDDCDCVDADTGNVLFKFRKKVIPVQYAKDAYNGLRKAATPTVNRGYATSGTEGNKVRKRERKKDGTISNTNVAFDQVNSGIVGYFDRYPRTPYCRQTAFTETQFEKFSMAYPIIKTVDKIYAELMPEHYKRQRAIADITSKDFVIHDTAFTTITVNKNFQTAVHTDKGDYKDGFGNLVVLRAGKYEGGYFCLPQYRVAINLNNCDLLLVDVHQPHGNTPIKLIDKNAERLSLVMYYRQNMVYCGTMSQELEFAKTRKEGNELVTVNLNRQYDESKINIPRVLNSDDGAT